MRNKPVRLRVTGLAINRNDEDEAINMTTFGTLSGDEKQWQLKYTERQAHDGEEHNITMTMGEDTVTVKRQGNFASDLVFRKGRRFEGSYRTPYGDLDMGIYPTKVNYAISPEGDGAVSLRYQLDIGGRYTSVHQLDVAFETRKKAKRADGRA